MGSFERTRFCWREQKDVAHGPVDDTLASRSPKSDDITRVTLAGLGEINLAFGEGCSNAEFSFCKVELLVRAAPLKGAG